MMTDPAAKLAESMRALLDGSGKGLAANAARAEVALKKYEAAVATANSKWNERGIPILSIDAKLSAFRYCLFSESSTEDALGHAVGLLAFAVGKFCEQHQCGKEEAYRIIESYTKHPTEILNPE